ADGDVDEIALARAAQAYAIDSQNTFDLLRGRENPALQSLRRDVEQSFERAPPHARSHPNDHSRNRECGERVRETQPGNVETLAHPHGDDAEENDAGAPNVGREMQCVRFQRFAGILMRHARNAASARPVNADHEREEDDGEKTGIYGRLFEQQTLDRFEMM